MKNSAFKKSIYYKEAEHKQDKLLTKLFSAVDYFRNFVAKNDGVVSFEDKDGNICSCKIKYLRDAK